MSVRKVWIPLFVLALAGCDRAASPTGSEAAGVGSGDALRASAPAAVQTGRYIVALREPLGSDAAAAQEMVSVHGGTLRHVYRRALNGFAADLTPAAAARLASNPAVKFVEQDQPVSIAEVQAGATWGLDRTDQRELPLSGLYSYDRTGAGVTVYVVDTGIRFDHAEFGGRAVDGFDAVGGGSAEDCHGHGTHVAGTIGGERYGVAKAVTLVAVRVLDCAGNGTVSGVIAGIDWITANRTGPAVANLSLGGGASQALDAAVRESIDAGVTYVVAAGNRDADACGYSPARVGEALTVGATTSSDARASFSNRGGCLDLFAPGAGITSASHSSSTGAVAMSGTSMAAPHVAGVAALHLEGAPAASPIVVADAILGSATAGKLTAVGTDSPNLLLFSPFGVQASAAAPTAVANGPYAGDEGEAITFRSEGSVDPDGGTLSYLWQFGDGTSSTLAEPTHRYADQGEYAVALVVRNAAGRADTSRTTASLANLNPKGTFSAPSSIKEGARYTLKFSPTDAGPADRATLQVWVDCGQGEDFQGPTTGKAMSLTCPVVPDQRVLSVRARVRDKDGGETDFVRTLRVTNAPPVVRFQATSATEIAVNDSIQFEGSFTDRGVNDGPWSYTVLWGDGTRSSGTLAEQGAPIPLSHVYAKAGIWNASLQVEDKDGKIGSSAKVAITVNP